MNKKPSEVRNLSNRIVGVTMPITRKRVKYGRNWLCMCGSGKKYKLCCLSDIDSITLVDGNANVRKVPHNIQEILDQHSKTSKDKVAKNV